MVHEHAGRPDSYVSKLIRRTTRSIIRDSGFTRSDTEDIEQDFWLHLLKQEDQYNPALSSFSTFADRIIGNKAKDVLRDHFAQCRSPRRESFSINRVVAGHNDSLTSMHETIASPEADPHRLDALRDDIVTLYDALPDDEQRVLAGKLAGLTHKDIRDCFGLSVRKFDAAWKKLRLQAKAKELDGYLSDRRVAAARNRVHER